MSNTITMSKVLAGGAAVVAALTLGSPAAHADSDTDFIQYMKAHGTYGTSADWESSAIGAAHDVCGMAASGLSRDGIKAHLNSQHPNRTGTTDNLVDGAISVYCPRYW